MAAEEAARRLDLPTRRLFLRNAIGNAIGLGSLTFLSGCDVVDGVSAERMLQSMSDFNDRVQALLFDPKKLAPEYSPNIGERDHKAVSIQRVLCRGQGADDRPSRFSPRHYGLAENQKPWSIEELHALPRFAQITRHICIEGWSAFGKWTGVRFSDFLARSGADLSAKYVTFRCDDNYITSIDMPTALYPQTQLAFWFDGEVLPRKYGFPTKLRIPTKLGFKNPKHIGEIEVGNDFNGGYWETYGYNWFSGL